MLDIIFPNYFYSLIAPPNRKELITTLNNAKIDKKESEKITWPNSCEIKVESLYPELLEPVLKETFNLFYSDIGIGEYDEYFSDRKILSIWKSTYNKGYYQEIHHHLTPEGSDFSGVIFLNDYVEGAAQFYFYNKHYSDMSPSWMKLLEKTGQPYHMTSQQCLTKPKAGDVVLFPSYMMHGVTMHRINQRRTTVAFNVAFR